MSDFPLITILTMLPLLGGIVAVGVGKKGLARALAWFCTLASLALALRLMGRFESATGTLQFVERHTWIPSLGVDYFVGVDGLGLLMVLLTAIVTPMALLASRNLFDGWTDRPDGETDAQQRVPTEGPHTQQRAVAEGREAQHTPKAVGAGRVPATHSPALYYALVLFLQSGLFGTFTALNFFHWFIFWELSLIPAFFLIRLWGGSQRAAAATQFFIYTMAGSIALLLSFLAVYLATGKFDFIELAKLARAGQLIPALGATFQGSFTPQGIATIVFLGAFLGFAVKVPLMPFHTWLPPAYAEAPSAITLLLTGLMSKMGVYGFLRILLPIFAEPMQWLRTPLLVMAVMTIVFSAGAAFAQRDLKRILAYSSVNHLGYCLLGVFAVATPALGDNAPATQQTAALSGVFLQMFNHGLTAATLFWCVSLLEQRSGGLRGLDDFGGLRKVAPVFCGLMGITLFSSLGLPGLNGFVGEFLIFKGVFPLATSSAAVSAIGLLVTAIFILTILQRVFHGPLNERWSRLPDLTRGECALLAAPVALMFVLGVYPQLALGLFNSTVVRMVEHLPF